MLGAQYIAEPLRYPWIWGAYVTASSSTRACVDLPKRSLRRTNGAASRNRDVDPELQQRLGCRRRCEALASSARRFDPFQSADTTPSAIIDPGTGKPAQAVDGATVRASSCMTADALTKIAMISETDAIELLEHYRASALPVSADGDVCITPDWHHAVYLAA